MAAAPADLALEAWLDRTILFVLSRALFRPVHLAARCVAGARGSVVAPIAATLTLGALTACRSFTQPIYQLEGLRGGELRARMASSSHGIAGCRAATQAFATASSRCGVTCFFCKFGLRRTRMPTLGAICGRFGAPRKLGWARLNMRRSCVFSSRFNVAAGFWDVSESRVELEAWDIEQEFRRAFAR